jgi:acylphosphatase
MSAVDGGEEIIRRRVLVSGHVQGVWFRESCRRTAARRDLGGFVRNLEDGRVEAAFEGPRALVDELVAWCRYGSSAASVDGVEIIDEPVRGDDEFVVA